VFRERLIGARKTGLSAHEPLTSLGAVAEVPLAGLSSPRSRFLGRAYQAGRLDGGMATRYALYRPLHPLA
jgi:hypothetical protein